MPLPRAAEGNPCYKGGTMHYSVYDASGKLRFESDNWPMARSALDLVIQEAQELDCRGDCPRLEIHPF